VAEKRVNWAGGCCSVAVVLVLIFILASLFMPSISVPRDKAKAAEAKQNLHVIQLALERYAADHDGVYPRYLIGGAAEHATAFADLMSGSSTGVSQVPLETVSDPLAREGYLPRYPHNPFLVSDESRRRLFELQADLATSITGDDPLRNGVGTEGAARGTRFGAHCRSIGQVLCDPRCEKFSYTDPDSGETVTADSWAIVEYRAWDMWQGNRPDESKHLLPGQFFYKAIGAEFLPAADAGADAEPLANEHLSLEGDLLMPPRFLDGADMYILGVYGGARTKGKDILGEETEGIWTRSCYSAVRMEGSSYIAEELNGSIQIQYGNPNGIRDGLILLLTAGEDYVSEQYEGSGARIVVPND